jgi:transposase
MIIFDRHVQIPRKPLPKYILIDEVHAVDSRDSKYACVIMDFVTQDIIDILPTRRKEDLVRYFTLIPREEREKVEIICSDCWKTYREITRICFPNAIHAFYTLCKALHKVSYVEKRVM